MTQRFAIGDEEWPGLAKIVEEAGEVLQIAGKLMMTHGEAKYFDGSDLRGRLIQELGDLEAAIRYFMVKNDASEPILDRASAKVVQFFAWEDAESAKRLREKMAARRQRLKARRK